MSGLAPSGRHKAPLDMQILRRVMSNNLVEGINKSRLRPTFSPNANIDPERATAIGKTLGELQDYRDLAHDESLKTEEAVKHIATEKRSIRDRIAETKAAIEHKKHLLEKLRASNEASSKQYESKMKISSDLQRKGDDSSKVLLDDAQHQLEDAYKLRDQILGAGAIGHTPTIAPQVKLKIEERMGALESKIDQDIEKNRRVAANLEANLDHAQRAVEDHNYRIDQTKSAMKDIISESDKLNNDIEREIDQRDNEITDTQHKLEQVQREKEDLKYRVNSLESEVNNLEFQKSRLDLEVEVRSLKDNKSGIIEKLNQRIEDANYNERHIRDL